MLSTDMLYYFVNTHCLVTVFNANNMNIKLIIVDAFAVEVPSNLWAKHVGRYEKNKSAVVFLTLRLFFDTLQHLYLSVFSFMWRWIKMYTLYVTVKHCPCRWSASILTVLLAAVLLRLFYNEVYSISLYSACIITDQDFTPATVTAGDSVVWLDWLTAAITLARAVAFDPVMGHRLQRQNVAHIQGGWKNQTVCIKVCSPSSDVIQETQEKRNTKNNVVEQHYTNIDWCRGQHWKIMPQSCVMLPESINRVPRDVAAPTNTEYLCISHDACRTNHDHIF